MAIEIGSAFGGIFGGAIGIIALAIGAIFVIGLIGGLFWYFAGYKKKFDIRVKIQSMRTGDPRIYFDQGAILFDKSDRSYYLKLLNTKGVEIELPKFNVLYHTNKGDYIELLRKSERDFRFLTPPKIRSDVIVTKSGKSIPVGQMEQRQIENDVSWIISRAKKNKAIMDPASVLGIILQHLPAIISSVMSLMVLYLIFKNAPALLEAMTAAADRFNQGNAPTVIGSMITLLPWKKKV